MGTIADKLQYLNGTKQAIKQAIIEKGQPVTDTDTFRSYANKIRAISGGGGVSKVNDITFYDYDGTIVKSYFIAEFASVTELPTPPEHERLTFQGWNWSIEDIKSASGKVDVGAIYVTKSGKSEFDMTFTEVTGLDLTLRIYNDVAGGLITVDWGDGMVEDATDTTIGLKTFTHSYSGVGNYMVSVDSTGDYSLYGFGSSPFNMFGITPNYTCTAARLGFRCSRIMERAFYNCYSLSSVTIPNSVTNMSTYTFYNCYSLSSVTIPNSVTSISAYVFSYCYSLSSVIIPNSVTSIGINAFYNCYSLASVIIPDGVTSIGNNAFYNCYSLASVIIPDGVTSIGNNAFQNCASLSSISIPNSVTSIGNVAFYNCFAILKYIFLSTTPPTLSNVNAFTGINDICIFEVPAESVELYKTATNWNQFANRIKAL